MRALLIPLAVLAACSSAPTTQVRVWGSMREALRQGHDEARVVPLDEARPTSVGVGALAGLEGEVTVVDGRVLVSEGAAPVPARAATDADAATLLVLADVPAWTESTLPACADLAALEAAVLARLAVLGRDPGIPTPLRIRGRATALDLHVIAGNCPVANPAGPAPWRHHAAAVDVELVGVLADGAAGWLTHHTGVTHLHAVTGGPAGELTGHLDGVALEAGATLSLPAGPGSTTHIAP